MLAPKKLRKEQELMTEEIRALCDQGKKTLYDATIPDNEADDIIVEINQKLIELGFSAHTIASRKQVPLGKIF
jgi:hypothetical protein